MSALTKVVLITAYIFIYLPNIYSQNLTAEQIYKKGSGAVVTQTNNIFYFIQQFCFGHLDFSDLSYITHSVKSNIPIHLVNDIRANNIELFNFKRIIIKLNKTSI